MAILWILYIITIHKRLELFQTNKCENPVLSFSQILRAFKIAIYCIQYGYTSHNKYYDSINY